MINWLIDSQHKSKDNQMIDWLIDWLSEGVSEGVREGERVTVRAQENPYIGGLRVWTVNEQTFYNIHNSLLGHTITYQRTDRNLDRRSSGKRDPRTLFSDTLVDKILTSSSRLCSAGLHVQINWQGGEIMHNFPNITCERLIARIVAERMSNWDSTWMCICEGVRVCA